MSYQIEFRHIHYFLAVAEDLHFNRQLGLGICGLELSISDVDLIIKAFRKVWSSHNILK